MVTKMLYIYDRDACVNQLNEGPKMFTKHNSQTARILLSVFNSKFCILGMNSEISACPKACHQFIDHI